MSSSQQVLHPQELLNAIIVPKGIIKQSPEIGEKIIITAQNQNQMVIIKGAYLYEICENGVIIIIQADSIHTLDF